ncbi:hypothetical protein C7B62_04945 [Pleurocapsa sp. CCALA 161]|uniref:hypothetical protein n=1 Tax=Pleurocapsa sp. CCALA 161 TaxID=2107688 RepID=UPI000D084385|nr:hypothetical protein [Pleurocapsa sp. CCALA 161]PSB11603.1 hypothetical protein C7B62_04945 [Pleurocapsa sp. CCALA 161]
MVDFPAGERMTLHQQVFVKGEKREAELFELAAKAPSQEIECLIKSEIKSHQELSRKNLRKEIDLDIYVTYSISSEGAKRNDGMEKILQKLEKSWLGFVGEKEQHDNANLQRILTDAFYQGYETWYNFLTQKLGLDVVPHNSETIWEKLTNRLTEQKIAIPQVIHVTSDGLELTRNSELNPISRIFLNSPVPISSDKYIQSQGKYIGVSSLEEKADGWDNGRDQMQTIWKVLSKAEVFDTEVFVQITKGDIAEVRENMRRVAQQGIAEAEESAERGKVDFASASKVKKAMEAGESLYDDKVPFKTAVVFLYHRDSPLELSRAYKFLYQQFRSPLELTNENVYPYDHWIDTLPISWKPLLGEYNRPNKYNNYELPAILPLVQPFSPDRQGLEFLTMDGGIPINFDLWDDLQHLLMIATSRAGKGILLTYVFNHHIARNVPLSIIDYPKEDGSGTYSDYVDFLGPKLASYFSPEKEKINIFEIPDLSRFNSRPDLRETRFNAFLEGLIEILEVMVAGCNPRPDVDVSTVKSLILMAVKQFYSPNNQKIYNRFQAAYKEGFGSAAWERTPTLHDFRASLGFEMLGLTDPSPEQISTMKFIKLRLDYWLSSKIGKAISAPSTIQTNTLVNVYALTKLNDEDDASVLTLAINQEAERKSMSHEISVIAIDEVSIQIKLEAVAKMVSRKCASGLKSGIQIIMAGQNLDSLNQSKYKADILTNVKHKMIGVIAKPAIDAIVQTLKYDPELIEANASKKFAPIKSQLATNWLLDQAGTINQVRFFANPITLAAAVNNPKEVNRRHEIIAQYAKEGKIRGIYEYGEEIRKKLSGN